MSFRDACLWVSWTLLTSIINIFSSIFMFSFDLFCFLLHYTWGLALADQVTSALLPSHHALIMVCLWSPDATSQRVRGARRLCKLIHNQITRTLKPLFLVMGEVEGWFDYGSAEAGMLSSWTSISVSLLILKCQSRLQVCRPNGEPSKLVRSRISLLDEGLLGSECETLLLSSCLSHSFTRL